MKLYQDGKVLLARFFDSSMVADNAGKTTSSLSEWWRTKTYVKTEEMLDPQYPPFNQPYQIAQSLFGGTWNDYNEVFIIQIAECMLDCFYCFVDPLLRQGKTMLEDGRTVGGWFSAEEVYAWWKIKQSGVLRVSGGEPMLAPEFILDLWSYTSLQSTRPGRVPFLWVDTNLMDCDRFISLYNERKRELNEKIIGFCGCFKGFTAEEADHNTRRKNVLKTQLETAGKLVKTGLQVFFYATDAVLRKTTCEDIHQFFHSMQEKVHVNAPKRTYVLEIHKYPSIPDSEEWHQHLGRIAEPHILIKPHEVWDKLCRDHYKPEILWLPSHQVPLYPTL